VKGRDGAEKGLNPLGLVPVWVRFPLPAPNINDLEDIGKWVEKSHRCKVWVSFQCLSSITPKGLGNSLRAKSLARFTFFARDYMVGQEG